MDLDSFRRTLSDDAPPAELTPALRGAWHGRAAGDGATTDEHSAIVAALLEDAR